MIPRPRIAVVGLLPSQARRIGQALGDKLDLRFVTSQEAISQLEATVAGAHCVILVTKFISHRQEQAVRSCRVPFLRMPSGLTRLRQMLALWVDARPEDYDAIRQQAAAL